MSMHIVYVPSPVLKIRSEPIRSMNKEIQSLMQSMLQTMYDNNGIGLAAVQVGIPKRIVVIDISDDSAVEEPLYMVNPEIIKSSRAMSTMAEGCLSVPFESITITRPKKITTKYIDFHGEEQTLHATGLLATCIQHEIDHLNGITIDDSIADLLEKQRIYDRIQQRQFMS